jgi:hypothetical protein
MGIAAQGVQRLGVLIIHAPAVCSGGCHRGQNYASNPQPRQCDHDGRSVEAGVPMPTRMCRLAAAAAASSGERGGT